MLGRFGLVKPGNPSKFSTSWLVFWDIHEFFVSSAKNDWQTFLWGVLQGGGLMWHPPRKLLDVLTTCNHILINLLIINECYLIFFYLVAYFVYLLGGCLLFAYLEQEVEIDVKVLIN